MKLKLIGALAAYAAMSGAAMAQTELTLWYHGAGNEVESNIINQIIDDFNSSQADYAVTIECESSSGVVAAVEAGLGVALLNTRHPAAPSTIRHWQDEVLPAAALPEVSLVARRSNRSRDAAVRSLLAELVSGFRDETIQVPGA